MNFHEIMKTKFEKNVKRIRTDNGDNGGEFILGTMRDYYAKEGIV